MPATNQIYQEGKETMTRDIATMDMVRTYEVVLTRMSNGSLYYTPCLVLNGRPTTWNGRMHKYARTARQALPKWAADRELSLVNAHIKDSGDVSVYTGNPIWEYCYPYEVSTTFHHRADTSQKIRYATMRCQYDMSAQIITIDEKDAR